MSLTQTFIWGGQVVKKLFTKEEILELRDNPYVASISEETITFTDEFKRIFYEQKQSGVKIRDIFNNHGISPDVIGEGRISSFSWRINKMARRTNGFTDLRCNNKRQSRSGTPETLEDRVRQLEGELEYTKQIVEFLKKIQMAVEEKKK